MDHRTYGETRNCKGCRYWSEMLAQAGGSCDGVEAMCMNPDSPKRNRYTPGHDSCSAWASGHMGAVDEPGDDPSRYEQEEA